MIISIRSLIKKTLLFIDNKTFKNRFFFDGEYTRWKDFDIKRPARSIVNQKVVKNNLNVYYLVPGTAISGGIAVVFQHVNRLLKKGYDVKILSLNNKNDGSWFPNQKVEIIPYRETKEILQSGKIGILVATGYSTAFTVDMAKARRKIYFVQSDESRFFQDDKKLTEIIRKTYTIPMEYMTEAKWIQKWLKDEFNHDAYYAPNGLDQNIFFQTKPLEPRTAKPRILIEGAINVPYKGMEDAYNAVKDLDAELWIVSNNGKPKREWRYDRFFECVSYGKMNEIYSSCDIFLKMSRIEGFFGPPMEAMACGCAVVVGKVTGWDEYIEHKKNALVVEQGDVNGARKAVEKMIGDLELRRRLIENGYQTAKKWNWEKSIGEIEKVISKSL